MSSLLQILFRLSRRKPIVSFSAWRFDCVWGGSQEGRPACPGWCICRGEWRLTPWTARPPTPSGWGGRRPQEVLPLPLPQMVGLAENKNRNGFYVQILQPRIIGCSHRRPGQAGRGSWKPCPLQSRSGPYMWTWVENLVEICCIFFHFMLHLPMSAQLAWLIRRSVPWNLNLNNNEAFELRFESIRGEREPPSEFGISIV